MKWISVEDRLPEENGHILVFCNDIISSWMELVNYYICPEYKNGLFEDLDGEDFIPIVTHWMPLPEPPE